MAGYDSKVFNGERMQQLLGKIKDEFSYRIPWGSCANNSGATALTAYVGSASNDASYKLSSNPVVAITFAADVGASATLNLNDTGAKALKIAGEAITATTLKGGRTYLLKYNGTNYDVLSGSGGRAITVNGNVAFADNDNTRAEFSNGTTVKAKYTGGTGGGYISFESKYAQGFCTCSTAADTTAKTVTTGLSNYELNQGTIVAVKFTNGISVSNATLSINNTTAKPIYHNGYALGAGVIGANEVVLLFYNGTQYEILLTKVNLSNYQLNVDWFNGSAATPVAEAPTYIRSGSNVTFTNSSNGEITISATDTTYDAATESNLGLVKVPEIDDTTGYSTYVKILNTSGGSQAQNNGKVYIKNATETTGGVLTDTLAVKLNGIESGATKDDFDSNYFSESNNKWIIKNNVNLGGSPTTTTVQTATDSSTKIATTAFVQSAIGAAQTGAAMFQGSAGGTSDEIKKDEDTLSTGEKHFRDLTAYKKGYYWVVAVAGTYCGDGTQGSGYSCEAGDFIFCIKDYSSSYSTSDFSVVQNNIDYIDETEVNNLWSAVFTPA